MWGNTTCLNMLRLLPSMQAWVKNCSGSKGVGEFVQEACSSWDGEERKAVVCLPWQHPTVDFFMVTDKEGLPVAVSREGGICRCTQCYAYKSCAHVRAVLAELEGDEGTGPDSDGDPDDDVRARVASTIAKYLDGNGQLLVKSISQVKAI